MKRFDFYYRTALRLALLFGIAIAGTFLSDHFHATGWFGDEWITEQKWTTSKHGYQDVQTYVWGARHYWYVWCCGSLFVIGLARVVHTSIRELGLDKKSA